MTAFLYLVMILAWGFSWYAIKLQLGPVPTVLSIAYRFVLAAAVLWLGLALTRRLRPVPWRLHGGIAAMGLALFAVDFLFMYAAHRHITSGVAAVLFSTSAIFNSLNQWLFLGRRPRTRVVAGIACGIAGIATLFAPDILATGGNPAAPLGIGLALAGTYVFSLGNLLSLRVVRQEVDLPNAVARGMTWAAGVLLAYALAGGHPLVVDTAPAYLASLAYLALVASVVGFLAYLSLVARVGADRAAYVTVMFPVVALAVSTVLEDYSWTPAAVAGLGLILVGNVALFAPPMAWRRPAPQAAPGTPR